jgi:hypothetical protein
MVAERQYTFQERSGLQGGVYEVAVMADGLWYFGTELKVLTLGTDVPLLNSLGAIDLVVSCIQLNAVVMMYVFIQEVGFFSALRIDLSYPFLPAPFGAAQVDLWLFNRFAL